MLDKVPNGDALIMKLSCLRALEALGRRPGSTRFTNFVDVRNTAAMVGATDNEICVAIVRGTLRQMLRRGNNAEKAKEWRQAKPVLEQLGVTDAHFRSAMEELKEAARTYYQPVPHF